MSVMVLSNFTWKMDTPDDLESLLYVILWHSIRYLPHNCPNIGPLMFRLFDDSDRYMDTSKHAGGVYKREVMTGGCVPMVGDQFTDLSFHLKGAPGSYHPVNYIIAKIIAQFRPYYVEHEQARARAKAALLQELDPFSHPQWGEDQPSMDITAHQDADDLISIRQRVDHTVLREIFEFYLDIKFARLWPTDDKTQDQLPEDYDDAKAKIYRSTLRSSKLESSVNNNSEVPESSQAVKRARSLSDDDDLGTAAEANQEFKQALKRSRKDSEAASTVLVPALL